MRLWSNKKRFFCLEVSGSLALQMAPMAGKAAAYGIDQLAVKSEGSWGPKHTLGLKIPVEGER